MVLTSAAVDECDVAVVVCVDADVAGVAGVGVAGVADGVACDVDVYAGCVDVDMCGGGDAGGCACVVDVVDVGIGCGVVRLVCADLCWWRCCVCWWCRV